MKRTLIALLLLTVTGCFTPNYKNIPLQTSEIPYVLADGDYKDNQGQIHPNQHNVWAMSQADVYDYMKYIRQLAPVKQVPPPSPTNTSLFKDEKIPYLPKFITKTRLLFLGIALFISLIILVFILKAKVKRLKKQQPQPPYDNYEEYEQESSEVKTKKSRNPYK